MKERLTNNLGLKILAVVIAVFMWLIMVNVSNPLTTDSKSVTVEMINEDVLNKSNLTYEMIGKNTVTVSYEVRVRDQYRISASDFFAYADLSQLYDVTGSIPVQVDIANEAVRPLIQGTPTVRPGVVRIETEPLQKKRFDIKAHTVGTEQEGYALGSVTFNPEYVYATGARSVIGQISSVGVEINIDGINSDRDGVARVKFYDANDNELKVQGDVKLNLEEVEYHVTILSVKNLALDFQVQGKVADGYRFTGVDCSIKNVSVEGLRSVLASISTLTVPGELLRLDGATKDVKIEVNLSQLLPDNISMAKEADLTAIVTLKVEPLETREVACDLKLTSFENGRENYNYYFEQEKVNLSIRGLQEDLEKLKEDDIAYSVDVGGMGPGVHPVELEVRLSDGFEMMGQEPVMIIVEDLSEESSAASEESSEGDNHTD